MEKKHFVKIVTILVNVLVKMTCQDMKNSQATPKIS